MNARVDELLATALDYLARGWSVIPVRSREKVPLVAWMEYQKRRSSPDELRRWWSRWPDANVGVVTGTVSGLLVLDIDPPEGLATAMARGVPVTPRSRTGGGGWHAFFTHPGSAVLSFAGRLPGLDLRGDGGFVVAPPSVHPSGRRYTWYTGHSPDDLPLANPPEWLLALSRPDEAPASAHPVEEWRKLVFEGAAKGQRNNSLARLAGHLLARGVDPLVTLELLQAWNRTGLRAPLPESEVEAVVLSITQAEARRRGVA